MNDLSVAIRENNFEAIRIALDNGFSINSLYSKGWTLLTSAAFYGNQRSVEFLLDQGADIDAQNSDAWTPLMVAVYFNHTELVRKLVAHRASTNIKNVRGETALSLANERGFQEIIEILGGKAIGEVAIENPLCFLVRRTNVGPDEFSDFNLNKTLYHRILQIPSFRAEQIEGWGEYRVVIEGSEISLSEEPVGLQICFETGSTPKSVASQIVSEICENIVSITGEGTEVIET